MPMPRPDGPPAAPPETILLLGKDGQVGWELQRALAPLGRLVACGRAEADLEDTAGLSRLIDEVRPDLIVNAAAYTAVDQAEDEPERAFRVNAEAVAVLAARARALGAWVIHYSTDYVFDGTKAGAYVEGDAPNPLSVYGQSKWQGEQALRDATPRHVIFRTSWVFSRHGANFPKTMLRLGQERNALSVVCDQKGAPTAASLIANVTALVAHRLRHDGMAETLAGTYHLAAAGETNWYEYACFVLERARLRGVRLKVAPQAVRPIPAAQYPARARRPANSLLETAKARTTFGLWMPDWRYHAAGLVDDLFCEESR